MSGLVPGAHGFGHPAHSTIWILWEVRQHSVISSIVLESLWNRSLFFPVKLSLFGSRGFLLATVMCEPRSHHHRFQQFQHGVLTSVASTECTRRVSSLVTLVMMHDAESFFLNLCQQCCVDDLVQSDCPGCAPAIEISHVCVTAASRIPDPANPA